MDIPVYSLYMEGKCRHLGWARSFGEAKRMQQDSLPEDLQEAYAGIQDGHPIFYTDLLTPELREKYPQLNRKSSDD